MVKTSAKGRLLATHPYNSIFFKINIKNPSRKKYLRPDPCTLSPLPPRHHRSNNGKRHGPTPYSCKESSPAAIATYGLTDYGQRIAAHHVHRVAHGRMPVLTAHLPVVHHTVTRTVYDNTVGNPQRIRHMAVDMARVMHRHRRRHIPRSTASAQNSGYGQRQ